MLNSVSEYLSCEIFFYNRKGHKSCARESHQTEWKRGVECRREAGARSANRLRLYAIPNKILSGWLMDFCVLKDSSHKWQGFVCKFQGKYGDLDASLISYGPCQTPTLGFCVQRHDEIQTFKPDPYWVLQVTIKSPDGQELTTSWARGRSFDKEVANMFLSHVKEHEKAV